MSTEIKPGQVWAWNDGRTGPGPEFTITSLGSYSGGGVRVNYSYSGDLDVFDLDVASIQKRAHLVKETDATAAPLDPKLVHVGDTVTVRFIETGEEITTKAYQPKDLTADSEWVYILGWPLNKPIGHGLAVKYFEILDHQPAPEPEPEWVPGTTGTATVAHLAGGTAVLDMRVMRVEWDGLFGFATQTGRIIEDGSTDWRVYDLVPDEPRPLPTRDAVRRALEPGWSMDSMTAMVDAVDALLRGESR